MIKTLLVPVLGAESDRAAFAAVLAVARIFDAHIDAVHIRFDPAALARSAGGGD